MQLRKNKKLPEQGRGQRREVRGGSPSAAFSYYNTPRSNEPRTSRVVGRTEQANVQTKPKKTKKLSQAPFWILAAVIVLCVGKVLWLSSDPKITILGDQNTATTFLQPEPVYRAAANKVLGSSITNHSKPTANLNSAARTLERQFPELAAVAIEMPLIGSRPIVYIQPATATLVLQASSGSYAVNKAGIVLAKLQQIPANALLVSDQVSVDPQLGKQALPSSTVSFVKTIEYQFAAAKIEITNFAFLAQNPYEIDAHIAGQAYGIKFNVQGDVLQQSGAAIATVQKLAGSPPSTYMDVRVPDRVYYK